MLEWAPHLRIRVLCNIASPITTIPPHLPPLPLILSFGFHHRQPPHFNLSLHDRVCAISITQWRLVDLQLHSTLNNTFPMLETLSLSGDCGLDVLPDNFAAPHLRHLHLRSMCFPGRSFLLTNATNLLSLRLVLIPVYDYILPEHLVEHLASMPHLEYLSLKFIFRSRTVRELPHPHITRSVLSKLSRFMYATIWPYPEDILSHISTPSLQDFRFAFSMKETLDVLHLSAFLSTIRNLEPRATVVTFYPHAAVIAYHPEQPSVSSSYLEIKLDYNRSRDRAVTFVARICSIVASALPSSESLEIRLNTDFNEYQLDSGLFAQRAHWHAFLRSFGSVKTLALDIDLVDELSGVFHQNNEALIDELLPTLSRLLVVMTLGKETVYQHFYSFMSARRHSGHSIDIQAISRLPVFAPTSLSWPFDTFGD
jgi:hypothetical protein